MITVFTAKSCIPCQRVKELIEQGKVSPSDVNLIDVETDEGFAKFTEEILSKGNGAVPSAYKDGKHCEIVVEDDIVRIICDEALTESLAPVLPMSAPFEVGET